MAGHQNITMGKVATDLKGDWFQADLRTSWAITVLYRWPSVPLVWLLIRMGFRPMAVSLLGLGLALSMPAQAMLFPPGVAGVTVALSGMVFQVLDCADGTLARLTGLTGKRGADADCLIDIAQWGLLYLAIGLLADTALGEGWLWTALAGVSAWARLLARAIRDRLVAGDDTPPGPLRPAQYPYVIVVGLSGLIPFLAMSGSWLGVSVCALLIYSLSDIAEALFSLFTAPDT